MHEDTDERAIDAALRQLPPGAEGHLRSRFGLHTPPATGAPISLPEPLRRQIEAAAFRLLRRNAARPLTR